MTILLYVILFISAIGVMIYDYKFQRIPMWLLIINYSVISLLLNYWLLFGILAILFIKWKDLSIDYLYILIMCYLIIRINNILSLIPTLIILFQILWSKKKEISLMVTLEMAVLAEFILMEVLKW